MVMGLKKNYARVRQYVHLFRHGTDINFDQDGETDVQ